MSLDKKASRRAKTHSEGSKKISVRIEKIRLIMAMQERMPTCAFVTKTKAFQQIGGDPFSTSSYYFNI